MKQHNYVGMHFQILMKGFLNFDQIVVQLAQAFLRTSKGIVEMNFSDSVASDVNGPVHQPHNSIATSVNVDTSSSYHIVQYLCTDSLN